MKILRTPKFIFLFLIILLLIDFFIIGKLDEVSRRHEGYGYYYPLKEKEQHLLYQRYGWPRILYNFSHFFQFWLSPPPGKRFHNLWEFLNLDVPPSSFLFNICHFFAFFLFSLFLLYFFRLPILVVFLIGIFFNIFHEYIAEGIYMDPSFNDLWVNLLGNLFGLLIWLLIKK